MPFDAARRTTRRNKKCGPVAKCDRAADVFWNDVRASASAATGFATASLASTRFDAAVTFAADGLTATGRLTGSTGTAGAIDEIGLRFAADGFVFTASCFFGAAGGRHGRRCERGGGELVGVLGTAAVGTATIAAITEAGLHAVAIGIAVADRARTTGDVRRGRRCRVRRKTSQDECRRQRQHGNTK